MANESLKTFTDAVYSLESRLDPEVARIIFVGQAWRDLNDAACDKGLDEQVEIKGVMDSIRRHLGMILLHTICDGVEQAKGEGVRDIGSADTVRLVLGTVRDFVITELGVPTVEVVGTLRVAPAPSTSAPSTDEMPPEDPDDPEALRFSTHKEAIDEFLGGLSEFVRKKYFEGPHKAFLDRIAKLGFSYESEVLSGLLFVTYELMAANIMFDGACAEPGYEGRLTFHARDRESVIESMKYIQSFIEETLRQKGRYVFKKKS